jgi:pimeloyl-ACP methyl ester carboxylesterase
MTTHPAQLTVRDQGEGRPILLLHGGAGPASVAAYAERLAQALPARVVTPTHPGFDGTDRHPGVATVGDLATVYATLLDELDLTGVTVVGNSVGGWIAAELALLGSPRVAGLVLVDAVGIEVPGHPVADLLGLTMPQIAQLSFHDPAAFPLPDPSTLPPAAQAVFAGNRAALIAYAGAMADPGLGGRLAAVDVPTLVVWGDSDRIVSPAYGRAYAAAIPGAAFALLPETGHLPTMESPEALTGLIREFAAERAWR